MTSLSRRFFLSTSLTSLTSACAFGADKPVVKLKNLSGEPSFRPDTLFLTWQRDPTTTMTIQWIGAVGETEDTNVYYTRVKNQTWRSQTPSLKPYPLTDLKVFRAELTDLTPGMDYQFRIGKESPAFRFRTMPAKANDTISFRFRTMPAKANDTISFISGGDCGINPHTIANNIQAARQDPQFALIGGDLGYDNGKSVSTSLAFLRNYSRHMIGRDGRLIPMLACIGNHEVMGGYNKPRTSAPFFYALFDGLYRDTGHATLDFGDYLSLVLLDTGHTSPIGGEQTSWLEKTLRARKEHPHVIVANHVPAYPSYRKAEGKDGKAGTGEHNRQYWVPLFEKYRVPVVLEHHDHTFKRTKPLLGGLPHDNGVLYLGDGSWGRLRAPQAPEKVHYLATASRDYHLSLHRLQGPERFHLALDENGRVMDVCRSGQRNAGIVHVNG